MTSEDLGFDGFRSIVAVRLMRSEGRRFFIRGITLSFPVPTDDSACDKEKDEEGEDGGGLYLEIVRYIF